MLVTLLISSKSFIFICISFFILFPGFCWDYISSFFVASVSQYLLLAGVVVRRAVVLVWRLSRPALARFAGLRHGDRASVRSALAGGAGQLGDDGGRLGR